MTPPLFPPPTTELADLSKQLVDAGYAVLNPTAFSQLTTVRPEELHALRASWNDLAPDAYLRDGGRYRRRRHASFLVDAKGVHQVPHRAHWQSLEYNALHGGIERWFEPIAESVISSSAWSQLLQGLAQSWPGKTTKWFVEAHQFRIDTTDGIGRPTPEGAHRDGVDYVAVVLVERHAIKGGETRVFDSDGPEGVRFTMVDPWSALLLDDARVIHESTPIQPLDEHGGYRDTLVVTFRAEGFQGR